MPIEYATMFDDKCNQEIVRRKAGKVFYGPPKVIALAVCEKDGVSFLGSENNMSRSTAALIIVISDIAISVIFTLALFRLRWYE
jgi:hypothetical protein